MENQRYPVTDQYSQFVDAKITDGTPVESEDRLKPRSSRTCDQIKKKLYQRFELADTNTRNVSLHTIQSEIRKVLKKQFLIQRPFLSFQTLPRLFLQLTYFKHFNSAQLIIHEKGSPFAESYTIFKHNESRATKIEASNFNKVFNLVKKSKYKQFNQTRLDISDIDIYGTFLAHTLLLQHHGVVVIISRNDFLPPSQTESDVFNITCNYLIHFFEIALISRKKLAIEEYKKSLLEHVQQNLFLKNNFSDLSEQHLSNDYFHLQRIELLGELLNTLKHELSNPLFGLGLGTQLLLDYAQDEEIKSFIQEINKNALRCQRIIESFSSLYHGQSTIEIISLHETIKEVQRLVRSESKQIPQRIIFLPPEIQDLQIKTNKTWLSLILFNLILNSCQALKSSDREDKLIKITVSKPSEGLVNIDVSDNGPGIPQNIQSKIFDPFFTTKIDGTGVGLIICKNLASKIGSKILFSSGPDVDTTFTLHLPIM